MFPIDQFRRAKALLTGISQGLYRLQQTAFAMQQALGRIESRQCAASASSDLHEHEFKVWSQWGEDGIIDFLLRNLPAARKVFVEFGVESYVEANTRFLLVERNWSGLVMDGSEENIRTIRSDAIYWRHNLKAVQAFITRDNINTLLRENGLAGEIGLLSIDIDGNDYWVWEAIDGITPAVVIVEYNARFGPERAVTVPYDAAFVRERAHHSCIYYGASLAALVGLARRKGYAFVGSNLAANNAFFVRRDLLPAGLRELSAAEGWRQNQFREARDSSGALTFLSPEAERELIASLPLVEVEK